MKHFKIQTLLKINCCMVAITAFRVTQHGNMARFFHFSLEIEFNSLRFINYTTGSAQLTPWLLQSVNLLITLFRARCIHRLHLKPEIIRFLYCLRALIVNLRPKYLNIPMLSTFKTFGRARNHGKIFPKLSQTSLA